MSEDIKIPDQFTHSVKVEETAKGVRISVHVYGNDRSITVQDAFDTYKSAIVRCETDNIPRAPMEIVTK